MIIKFSKIYTDESNIDNAGRGVFAKENIKKNEEIEICPALVLPKKDYQNLKETKLRDYYFMWGDDKNQVAIALGYGSLYNHSYKPNATYKKHLESQTITFIALEDIAKDEEITVNYNYGNPEDKSELWIEDIPANNN